MQSPLNLDKKTVEKYKIPKEVELNPRQKVAFLEDQLHQLKSMHWRARVDVLHSKRLQDSDNEVLKNKGFTNESTHVNEVEQTIGAIKMISSLLEEIRKESPDLGETNAQDNPEGA